MEGDACAHLSIEPTTQLYVSANVFDLVVGHTLMFISSSTLVRAQNGRNGRNDKVMLENVSALLFH